MTSSHPTRRWAWALLAAPLTGCSQPSPLALGYVFSPVVHGSLGFEDRAGNITQYAIDDARTVETRRDSEAPCYATSHAILDWPPPEWDVNGHPEINCDGELPQFWIDALASADSTADDATVDWPRDSREYAGYVSLGRPFAPVTFRATISESTGTLRAVPPQGADLKLRHQTTDDYFRAYTISATVDCVDISDVACDGTWALEVRYEQSADEVSWLYADQY